MASISTCGGSGIVVAIGLHLVVLRTDWNARGRYLHTALRSDVLLASVVEINEGLDVLVIEKRINLFGIMCGIEKHFIYRAQDEANRIMPRGRLKSWIQRQIVFTVRRRDHVQVVAVIMLCPIPSCSRAGRKDDDGCNQLYRGRDNHKPACFGDKRK